MSGTSSSAATKCISEVPGLAKQTSTPAPTRVRMSASAPFTGGPRGAPSRRVVDVEVRQRHPAGGELAEVRAGGPALRGTQGLAHGLLGLEVQLGDEVGRLLGV